MKKIFSVMFLAAMIFIFGQNKIEASDIWLYTDKNGAEYYLREYTLAARSWCFAHVVKVSGNTVKDLAYKFELYTDIPYAVCEGSDPSVFVSRNPPPILEEGKTAENPIASKIWKDYLGPMDAERWARIREHENGRR